MANGHTRHMDRHVAHEKGKWELDRWAGLFAGAKWGSEDRTGGCPSPTGSPGVRADSLAQNTQSDLGSCIRSYWQLHSGKTEARCRLYVQLTNSCCLFNCNCYLPRGARAVYVLK